MRWPSRCRCLILCFSFIWANCSEVQLIIIYCCIELWHKNASNAGISIIGNLPHLGSDAQRFSSVLSTICNAVVYWVPPLVTPPLIHTPSDKSDTIVNLIFGCIDKFMKSKHKKGRFSSCFAAKEQRSSH